MEKVGTYAAVKRGVNHLSFGDIAKIILNPVYAIADSKDQRANLQRNQLKAMISFIQESYDKNDDPVSFSDGYGTMKVPRNEGVNHLPDGMKEPDPGPGKIWRPTYAAYIWARQQAYFLAGFTQAEVEEKTGYPAEKVDISGKIEWSTILKQAGVFVGSILAGFVAAGPAGAVAGAISGMAATKAIQNAANIAKLQAMTKGATVIQANVDAQIAAEQEAARILAESEAAKQAGFFGVDFNDPMTIIPLMAAGALVLFMVFKKR